MLNRQPIQEPRRKNDFYPTPEEVIPAILELKSVCGDILDPGCGLGVWGKAVRKKYPEAFIVGVDIDEFPISKDYDLWLKDDFLNWDRPYLFDMIVGNPPFKYAEEFIEKSLSLLYAKGIISFLLPIEFLGSQKRMCGLFKYNPPKEVYISSRRMPFKAKSGKSNPTTTHAQFIWEKGYAGDTKLKWFDWKK